MAFLPRSLIGEELARGGLVHAGEEERNIPMGSIPSDPGARLSTTAEIFCSIVTAD